MTLQQINNCLPLGFSASAWQSSSRISDVHPLHHSRKRASNWGSASYETWAPWYPSTRACRPELQWIIQIIWYSNSWDRIVLFVFGIRSICDFRIIFEYPNSCHRILNSSRIFYKKDMCRKHSKNLSCRYENKGSNFPHLIWSQNSHIKFFGGLLFDFKYSVFE